MEKKINSKYLKLQRFTVGKINFPAYFTISIQFIPQSTVSKWHASDILDQGHKVDKNVKNFHISGRGACNQLLSKLKFALH